MKKSFRRVEQTIQPIEHRDRISYSAGSFLMVGVGLV